MTVDASMVHLGFVAEDGIDESEDRPTTKIFAWGGDIVAAPQDSYSLTEVFTLYEFLLPEVAKAAYGDDNVTVTAATASAGTKMSHPRDVGHLRAQDVAASTPTVWVARGSRSSCRTVR